MLKDHVFKDLLAQMQERLKVTAYQDLMAVIEKWNQEIPQNALLIEIQRPDATEVKSWYQWAIEGREVTRGERGIKTMKLSGDVECKTMRDGQMRMCQHFRIIHLFDITQTRKV